MYGVAGLAAQPTVCVSGLALHGDDAPAGVHSGDQRAGVVAVARANGDGLPHPLRSLLCCCGSRRSLGVIAVGRDEKQPLLGDPLDGSLHELGRLLELFGNKAP